MQSSPGLVTAAVAALQKEDLEEALTYIEEVRQRFSGRSDVCYNCLSEGGWYEALEWFARDTVILVFTGGGKEVTHRHRQLVRLAGVHNARRMLLASLLESTTLDNKQRLYKVACRHMSYVEATQAFRQAGFRVYVPKKFGRYAEVANQELALQLT